MSFRYLWFSRMIGGTRAATERLPTLPGIYAWFRDLTTATASPEEFSTSILRAIDAPAAPAHIRSVGPMHRVTLEARSSLSEARRQELSRLSVDENFRRHLGDVMAKASILQAPLYIGKTVNLQQRIEQHLDPMSDLSVRLREAEIKIRTCILAYTVLPEEPATDDSALRLIEDIVTRLCRPGFVLRPG